MKRQRNIQQVKEHGKYPPKQTKKEKIGSLSEKWFRTMKVKMLQNLENKINSVKTRIEMIQEMFNKDPEEMTKSQSTMNNEINEIKNTLEGTNSRITGDRR